MNHSVSHSSEDSLRFCHYMLAERVSQCFAELQATLDEKAGYRSDQPRVPAGQPTGGQWVGNNRRDGYEDPNLPKPNPLPTPGNPYPDAIERVYPEAYIGGGAAIGRGIARGIARNIVGEAVSETPVVWHFGAHKSPAKWERQMEQRGWVKEQIGMVLNTGKRKRAPNFVNKKNKVTAYIDRSNPQRFVVRDDKTGAVLQISGTNAPVFIRRTK